MNRRRASVLLGILLLTAILVAAFLSLRPSASRRSPNGVPSSFEISEGEGFRAIAARLAASGFIRSRLAFEVYALMTGAARQLKPGSYELDPSLSTPAIANRLKEGINREAVVTIPEGSNMYDIDILLAENGVLSKGALIALAEKSELEGYLFPDTYRFYLNSDATDVQAKFAATFERNINSFLKATSTPASAGGGSSSGGKAALAEEVIVMASILEKEVQTPEDKRIVAGILWKRLAEGMPLQVDASVCYAKRMARPDANCYPVTSLDTKKESPYNTYLHKGLPPGPIGNPGISAVQAAVSPIESSYWYYLSDPVTKRTVFSKTLAEHEKNRAEYLLYPRR